MNYKKKMFCVWIVSKSVDRFALTLVKLWHTTSHLHADRFWKLEIFRYIVTIDVTHNIHKSIEAILLFEEMVDVSH